MHPRALLLWMQKKWVPNRMVRHLPNCIVFCHRCATCLFLPHFFLLIPSFSSLLFHIRSLRHRRRQRRRRNFTMLGETETTGVIFQLGCSGLLLNPSRSPLSQARLVVLAPSKPSNTTRSLHLRTRPRSKTFNN